MLLSLFISSFSPGFVLGSSIWPKNAFIKTFAAGVVIVVVYILIALGITDLMKNVNTYYWFGATLTQERVLDYRMYRLLVFCSV